MKKTSFVLALVISVASGCDSSSSKTDAGAAGRGGAGAGGGGGHGGAAMPVDGSVPDSPTDTPAATFTVGGTIAGLSGTGLVLRDNGGDDLVIPAGATSFTFATPVATGSAYAVTVLAQPSSPTQACTVTGGTGTVGASNVTTVAITCVFDAFTVGGTITGLTGTGLVLQDNAGDDLPVPAGATTFTFPTAVPSGAPYAVTVLAQPTAPSQLCTVAAGTGTVTAAGITDVAITCVPATFTVGGTITGLTGTGLVLQDNAGDNLTVAPGATTFAFATPVASGSPYAVTVLAQPTGPAQTCTVATGTGTVGAADLTSVAITCTTKTFAVSGTITGLTGSGLVLQDNGGDNLTVPANATTFMFAKPVASGSAFAVTVLTQPSTPAQTCVVSGGTGTIGASPVTSVVINCTADKFTVGGQITGLRGPVVLHNGSENQTVTADGMFAFPTPLLAGSTYAVTVATQPTAPSQTCVVTSGTGTVANANITNVMIACTTNSFHVNAVVTGLAGNGLILRNNGENALVTAPGTVMFPAAILSGGSYAVSVAIQPTVPSQTCTVGPNATGVVGASDVSVAVTCVTNTYNVRVTVSGLIGTGLILHSGADSVPVAASSTFNMPTKVASGTSYQVTVAQQPTSPTQTCTVTPSAPATVGGGDALVAVACATTTYQVRGMITGLTGTGLVLQNNGGDDITVPAGATSFMFLGRVASGGMYNVTVLTQPTGPVQTCTPSANVGPVTTGDITGVTITCTTALYTVSAQVVGLTGTGLVLQNNNADNLPVASNMTAAFSTQLSTNQTFSVSVLTQPTGQTCIVTPPSGTVTANVTVLVDCAGPHPVGGTIAGLVGTGLILQNNLTDDLAVPMSSTTFTFTTPLASGSDYAVTVSASPANQVCAVTANASGTISGADVNNVAVDCAICGVIPEPAATMPIITCPAGQTISSFDFVSYGTATGTCGNYALSSCNSANSRAVVEAACLGQQTCFLSVANQTFVTDPCAGENKTLTFQAHCQ